MDKYCGCPEDKMMPPEESVAEEDTWQLALKG